MSGKVRDVTNKSPSILKQNWTEVDPRRQFHSPSHPGDSLIMPSVSNHSIVKPVIKKRSEL